VSPDHARLLRVAAMLHAAAAELETIVSGGEPPRPPAPAPTRAWCFLPGGLVRWAGPPVPLRRGLRDLLGALLDLGAAPGRPVSYDALDEALDHFNDRRARKDLSELNVALSRVGWPHEYHAGGGAYVFTD
jgi:hypothetical protein